MAEREYRMKERAKAQEETRERIVRATIALHDEQGVAATSFLDIAKRSGVGAATVYRHFPTIGSLVAACGAHVWAQMDPPRPEQAPALFAGLATRPERFRRLAEALDEFHARGALRLQKAGEDRSKVAELDRFLAAVEAGEAAWVRAAVADENFPERTMRGLVALSGFPFFAAMDRAGLEAEDRIALLARLFGCAATN
jgi:AcrR family transcriptional regulator